MTPYYYICSQCSTRYPASEIESDLIYLCPRCGKSEPSRPLEGVLLIHYDYAGLRKKYDAATLLHKTPGRFWEYPELWPLKSAHSSHNSPFEGITEDELNALSLPFPKVRPFKAAAPNLFIMDETNNPTYSYKDRASILVALKVRQLGIGQIAAASTGNAGSSLAGICARLGLTARLWLPESIPLEKLLQVLGYGAEVHLVKGDYDQAFDLCLELSARLGWYNRNTAYNPLTIEGKKSAAYDMFIEMQGKLPDYIFVPVGDGVILSGIYKGFWELRELGLVTQLPRLVAVQSRGSDALVRYLESGAFEYRPPKTTADSISAGAPRNLFLAAQSIRKSGGLAMAVEDDHILKAVKTIGKNSGILVEPAAAAPLAGYLKMRNKPPFKNSPKTVLLLTGSGLKDVESFRHSYPIPDSKDVSGWKNYFLEVSNHG